MLTKKGKYGLKAMVHLAGLEPDALAQVAEIAKANSMSKGFLDQILTELRGAGLVDRSMETRRLRARPSSRRYRCRERRARSRRAAGAIRCASVTAYRACDDCADLRNCPVRRVMVDARNAIAHLLDNYTLAEMCALKEPLQLADMYDI